jgi:hypothetical protein
VPKHADDDPVLVSYSSTRNITFYQSHQPDLGYTWGEWREMTDSEQSEALNDYASNLVDIWVEEDEN